MAAMSEENNGNLILTCPEHHEVLVSGLWNLLSAGHGVDFHFHWRGRPIPVHRLLLDVFISPENLKQTIVDGNSCLHELLEFIYKGTVTIKQEQLQPLLSIANRLDFQMLVDTIKEAVETSNYYPAESSVGRRLRSRSPTVAAQSVLPDTKKIASTKSGAKSCRSLKKTETVLCHANSVRDDDDGGGEASGSAEVTCQSVANTSVELSGSITKKLSKGGRRKIVDKSKTATVKAKRPKGRKKYICEYCDHICYNLTVHQVHRKRHDPSIIVHRCLKCKKVFLSAELLDEHRPVHAEEPEWYECNHCDYRSTREDRYRIHLSRHDDNVGVYKCKNCHEPFFSKEKLEAHMLRHKPYSCTHCEFATPIRRFLYKHLFDVHQVNCRGETVVPFSCADCDYKCRQSCDLRYHRAAMHGGDKPYKCPQCTFASGRKGETVRHFNSVHLNIKPHLCETCGFRTVSQSALGHHKRTHTGEKIYNCNMCDMVFGDHSILRRHKQKYHGIGTAATFICDYCGKTFSSGSRLKRHANSVHRTADAVISPDVTSSTMVT